MKRTMEALNKLSADEKELLLSAPAYISMLAANEDGKMDEKEKKRAIELSHIKTFSAHVSVKDYYREVEKDFMQRIEKLEKELPENKEERENEIRKKLARLDQILEKLDFTFSSHLKESFRSYGEHVAKSHFNILPHFLDPFYWVG